MITAAISTVLGMLGGVLPDVMKEVRESRNHARELEFLRVQADLQIKTAQMAADNRLRDIEGNAAVEEMRAFAQNLTAIIESQARPTGIRWIDGFNAVLRPSIVSMLMALFLLAAVPYVAVTIASYWLGDIDGDAMGRMIFGSMIGESFMACFGYLFGYRSSLDPAKKGAGWRGII